MALHFDHVVILVDELEQAVRDYTELGFTVVPGGQHANGLTHNALIAFADGAYLEILAFLDGLEALGELKPEPDSFLHRVKLRGQAGEGIVDYALGSDALERDVAAAREGGVEVERPQEGGRLRPDGKEMRWQNAVPHSPLLPFLITDLTPRSLRVPEGEARRHPNGVTGVLRLVFAVDELAGASAAYSALLGREPVDEPGVDRTADFLLESTAIRLVEAGAEQNRPLSLTLRTADPASVGQLERIKAHGAPIELLADSL